MDAVLSPADQAVIRKVLQNHENDGLQFHALQTRQSGVRKFVSFHVLVPGEWTARHSHDLLERIEAEIRQALPGSYVFTHLEPLDDPASFADQTLERMDLPPAKSASQPTPPEPPEAGRKPQASRD
jgi:divalent metal cation (Fe/Co/Zn/Cd) transporter